MRAIHCPTIPVTADLFTVATSPMPIVSRMMAMLAWHFHNALVMYSAPFKCFRSQLGMPKSILQIPVTQTTQVPCRAMDINQSTNDGQAQILENLLAQANLGDPTDNPSVVDIRGHVILVHGDLSTAEHLEGIWASHAIEIKPIQRLQYPVFIMGLFHYQMACADAIWWMYIKPKSLRSGPNSLYQQACSIRPHDSGRIASKPGFHLMHDLIHQCAHAWMLDCWRVEVAKRDHAVQSLELFAAKEPSWQEIVMLSQQLAMEYLNRDTAVDTEFGNNTVILARLLQYLEVCHATKHGDIG